jgi:hypothetical protein
VRDPVRDCAAIVVCMFFTLWLLKGWITAESKTVANRITKCKTCWGRGYCTLINLTTTEPIRKVVVCKCNHDRKNLGGKTAGCGIYLARMFFGRGASIKGVKGASRL